MQTPQAPSQASSPQSTPQPQSAPETSSPPSSQSDDTADYGLGSIDDAVDAALAQFDTQGDTDGGVERREKQHSELPGNQDGEGAPPSVRGDGDKTGDDAGTEPSTEDAATPRQDGPRASAWATFHKQQKEHQEKVAAFAQEKAEIQKLKSAIDNAKVDRLAALELLGYDDPRKFIEGIAEDGGRMTPERKQLYELKKWKEQQETEKQEAARKQQEQMQAQQHQQRLDSLKTNIVNTIKGEFGEGLVSMPGGVDAVLSQMDQMAAENPGTMPRIEDAISAVEKMYTTQIAALLGNPKARQLAEEHLASLKPDKTSTAASHRPVTKTIGSEATSRVSANRDPYVPTLSGDAEVEEAIAKYFKPRGI